MSDDIVDVIDMCLMQSNDNMFIQNASVATEKVIFLANLCQMNNVKRFCTSKKQISILGIDPKHNLGPYFVTISTYRHLQFLTKEKVSPVMIGLVLLQMNKEYSSYFNLSSEMIRLQSNLTNIKVFGSLFGRHSIKNVYQPFRHLLCNLHMKDNVKEKLNQEKINIVMRDIFGRKEGEIIQKGLVDAQSIDEFDEIYENLKAKWQILEQKVITLLRFLKTKR